MEHSASRRRQSDITPSIGLRASRILGIAVATAAGGLFLTACGGSSTSAPSSTSTTAKAPTSTSSSSSTTSTTSSPAGSSTSTSASSTTSTTMATTPLSAADQAAITQTFNTVFDLGNPAAAPKAALIEGGSALQSSMQTMMASPLATGVSGATVTSMGLLTAAECQQEALTSPCAQATYTIMKGASPLLSGQTGYAVQQGNTWLLATTSICGLISQFDAAVPGSVAPVACSVP